MRVDGNYGAAPAYTPNSYNYWVPSPEVAEPPLDLEGSMWRFDPKDDPTDDNFRDGGDLYRLMTEDKRQILIDNTARNMNGVTDNIKYRHAVHCLKADEEYGTRMTAALGLNIDEVRRLSKLSNNELIAATMPEQM
jgi:catalase